MSIIYIHGVVHPNYHSIESRIETFKDIPTDVNNREILYSLKDKLCEAGFFYKPYFRTDNVECFCCGLQLIAWKLTDIPWKEHNQNEGLDCFYNQMHHLHNVKSDLSFTLEKQDTNTLTITDRLVECSICLHNDDLFAFNCGHISCIKCIPQLKSKCPKCRSIIKFILRIYI